MRGENGADFFMARTYWRAVTSSNMADGLYYCHRWYPYHNKSIANQNTLEKANGTGTANTGNKGYTILLTKTCMHLITTDRTKIIYSMYREGEVSVHRACCERTTQPYSLGGEGGTIYPGY